MTPAGGEDAQAGFSLVEMLVSLALVSLMAVYALSALSSLKNAERVSQEIAAQEEVDAVVEFMAEELSGARLHLDLQNPQNPKLVFDGQPHRVSFVTAGDTRREVGGLYLVTYWLDESSNLMVTRKILSGDSQSRQDVTLLQKVQTLDFTYSDKDGLQTADWQDKNTLPYSIAAGVTFSDGDHRSWKVFRAAPELSH